jgi:hypothetical protein
VYVRRGLLGLVTVTLSAGTLCGCGSSRQASPPDQGAQQTCQAVSAVLSDGPDPDADPVGYAFAQILPLRQIKKSSDGPLQSAIDNLAQAYQEFYNAKGTGHAVQSAVSAATQRMNRLCPGAGAAS